MRIALVSPTPVPPTFGGMDRLLQGLLAALRERHETDLVTIPVDERTREGVLRGYYDFFHLDLGAYDRVISYKAPGYMARHPNHVVYLSHRLRTFYDLYQPGDEEHARLRDLIHWLDEWALDKRRIPHLFTVGETVCRRLRKFGDIDSVGIHHPSTFEPVAPGAGEYFLSVGRLHPWKRVDLIIKAFRKMKAEGAAECGLLIAGEGPQEAELRALAAGDERIRFAGMVADAELPGLYSRALATVFPPISEDMGLITFESFLSGKPILTTTDAGEPALIVEEGRTGWVVEPTPEAMAARMDAIWRGREALPAMAEHCAEWMRPVTWDRLVDALLEAGDRIAEANGAGGEAAGAERDAHGTAAEPMPPPAPPMTPTPSQRVGAPVILESPRDPSKYRLLVTDNQIIDPPVGGGRVRILELYRHMPEDFDTVYVGAFDYPGPVFRDQQYKPNFREILTPLTAPHFKAHGVFHRLTGGAATIDVTMPKLGGLTPRYRRLIDEQLPEADALVCAHPWMIPFLPENPGVPVVYDSQNCEALVKGPLLRGTLAGRWLARGVRRVEAEAIRRAALVLACSAEDAAAFGRLYGADAGKLFEAANGVDCGEIAPAGAEAREEARRRLELGAAPLVVFTGSNYEPNLEGAVWIIERLAPAFPAATFAIAGGVGPMYRERFPDRPIPANANLLGFIEREALLELYRAADAALNPMAQGSGTNIKMLDYMAAGIAILTTPVGARGLRGTPGQTWAEAPLEDFGRELAALLEAPERRRAFAAAGRAHAEANFDWSAIAAAYADRLRPLLAPRPRVRPDARAGEPAAPAPAGAADFGWGAELES